jgi:hypothetical protein
MTEKCRTSHDSDDMPAADRIAASTQKILSRGLDLSAETLRFLDSTLGHPSAAELSALLADDTSPERDSLLELLFSPDEALQIELEDRLDIQPSEHPSAEEVVARLVAASLAVRFRFPDGRGILEVVLTAPLARRLVLGLGINRDLPARLSEVIAAHASGNTARRVRVMIRNARFTFTPANREFLCALLPKLDLQDDTGRACLAFALEMLAEIGGSADIYTALAARKRWLSRALHHSRQLREHLAHSNVETLLSQGQRLTWTDEALARRQMDYIDHICLAVFGRSEPVDTDESRQRLDLEGPPDIADLMRRLS